MWTSDKRTKLLQVFGGSNNFYLNLFFLVFNEIFNWFISSCRFVVNNFPLLIHSCILAKPEGIFVNLGKKCPRKITLLEIYFERIERGFRAVPSRLTSKCKWIPEDLPVDPIAPITSPFDTF